MKTEYQLSWTNFLGFYHERTFLDEEELKKFIKEFVDYRSENIEVKKRQVTEWESYEAV